MTPDPLVPDAVAQPPTQTVNYAAKSIFASATLWFNIASALVMIFGLPEVTALLGPKATPYVGTVIALLNIVLRFNTVRPVAVTLPTTVTMVKVEKLVATP